MFKRIKIVLGFVFGIAFSFLWVPIVGIMWMITGKNSPMEIIERFFTYVEDYKLPANK
jgi:hypothetical protein